MADLLNTPVGLIIVAAGALLILYPERWAAFVRSNLPGSGHRSPLGRWSRTWHRIFGVIVIAFGLFALLDH